MTGAGISTGDLENVCISYQTLSTSYLSTMIVSLNIPLQHIRYIVGYLCRLVSELYILKVVSCDILKGIPGALPGAPCSGERVWEKDSEINQTFRIPNEEYCVGLLSHNKLDPLPALQYVMGSPSCN